MSTILESARNRIFRRKQDHADAKVNGINAVIWQTACEMLGQKIAKPMDEQAAAEVVEAAEEQVDIQKHVQLATNRIGWAKTASHLEDRKRTAEALEKEIAQLND